MVISKELMLIVTRDGIDGLVGIVEPLQSNNSFVALKNALLVTYTNDGIPYLTQGQLPNGFINMPFDGVLTKVPASNIAYTVSLDADADQHLCRLYKDAFTGISPEKQ